MEADILKSLEFELGSPTIKTFLRQVQWSVYLLLLVIMQNVQKLHGLVTYATLF